MGPIRSGNYEKSAQANGHNYYDSWYYSPPLHQPAPMTSWGIPYDQSSTASSPIPTL